MLRPHSRQIQASFVATNSKNDICSLGQLLAELNCMGKIATKKNGDANSLKAEARELRRIAKRIASSKSAARRFLAATGMYSLKGELKPQFR